jgi:hypothetical protein
MLLSTSELFWVGLIRGFFSTEVLAPPDDAEYYDGRYDLTLYGTLLEYAERCGLGMPAIKHDAHGSATPHMPIDMHWGRNGDILSAEEIACGSSLMASVASATREGLIKGDPSCELANRFDELLEEHAPVAFGYSPQTPGLLYGLKKSGRIVAVASVPPTPQGIVRIVLELLAPLIDTPASGYMAVAAAGKPVTGWHEDWIPSIWSLDKPLKDPDRPAAIDVIERELVGAERENAAYQLGQRLGRAEQLLRESRRWIAFELQCLQDKSIYVQALDFHPTTSSDDVLSEVNDHDNKTDCEDNDSCHTEEPPFEDQAEVSVPDDEGPEIDDWVEEVRQALRAASAQTRLGGVEFPPTHPGLSRHVTEAVNSLTAARSLVVRLGIDSVIPALDSAISRTSAFVAETIHSPELSPGVLLRQRVATREALLDCLDVLQGTVALAFGEFRLKELADDSESRGFEPLSLQGWSNLVGNARVAVRDGLTLLKNGFPPYVVINAVQPTLEAIVRNLAAKHLAQFHGIDLGNMLYSLLQHAKTKHDSDLEAIVSIGLALRLPRNNAVHNAERVYDKHDAAFFINGLAIMLRGLA